MPFNRIVCRHDPNCTRLDCHFLHPSRAGNDDQDQDGGDARPPVVCMYEPNCTNPECTYYHPPVDIDGKRQAVADALARHDERIRDVNALSIDGGLYGRQGKKKRRRNKSGKRDVFSLQEMQRVEQERAILRSQAEELRKQRVEFVQHSNMLLRRLAEEDSTFSEAKLIERKIEREIKRIDLHLPIYSRRTDVIDLVRNNQVVVLIGETGSGKTTQLIQYLADANYDKIVCTQPRKVAAISVARRVASEWGCKVGREVGFHVGSSKSVSSRTRMKFVTDRLLLNELISRQFHRQYDVIIVDEAHERSIDTDLLLGMLKTIAAAFPDTRIIVTSATLDEALFCSYFNNCPSIKIAGRTFPVDVHYAHEFQADFVTAAVQKTVEIINGDILGDVLVFLTGQQEIEAACNLLPAVLGRKKSNVVILPLHGKLPPEEQEKVFLPVSSTMRKVVFATNSAETSVTIDGIKFVIDSGMSKELMFDARKGMNILEHDFITKSSALQRTGRAGRTSSGVCYRLFTENDFENMRPFQEAEILRVDLGQAILKLKQMRISKVSAFDFIESPSPDNIDESITNLRMLGAIDENECLTPLGAKMAALPLIPALSKMLITGVEKSCVDEILTVISMLSVSSSLFWRGSDDDARQRSEFIKSTFSSDKGDFITYLNVFRAYSQFEGKAANQWCRDNSINSKAMETALQMKRELKKAICDIFPSIDIDSDRKSDIDQESIILRVISSSLFNNLSLSNGGSQDSGYQTIKLGQNVLMHPGSSLVVLGEKPQWVTYMELSKTSRVFIRNINIVESIDALREDCPGIDDHIDLRSAEVKTMNEIVFNRIGSSLLSSIIGPHGKTMTYLERKLDIVIKPCFESQELRVWHRAGNGDAHRQVETIMNEKRKELMDEILEVQVAGHTRIVLQHGAVVQRLLFHTDFLSVNISNVPNHMDEMAVKEYLSQFGPVIQLRLMKFGKEENNGKWGIATFSEPSAARQAVETVNGEFSIRRQRAITDEIVGTLQTTVNLRWFVGKSKGIGFIYFRTVESRNQALAANGTLLGGMRIIVKLSTKDFGPGIFISGLSQQVDEEDLRNHFKHYGTISSVSVPREPYPHEFGYQEEQQLRLLLSQHGEITSLVCFPPTKSKSRGKAYVIFSSEIEAQRAVDHIKNSYIPFGSGRLRIQTENSFRFMFNADMFNQLKPMVDTFKDLAEGHLDVVVSIVEKGEKGASIKISGEELDHVTKAKAMFDTCFAGSPFETDGDMSYLARESARDAIDRIMSRTGTFIRISRKQLRVIVYGNETSKLQAMEHLHVLMAKAENTEKQSMLHLPPGAIKLLVDRDGQGLERLKSEKGLTQLRFNAIRQTLEFIGNSESVELAEKAIRTSLQEYQARTTQQSSEVACPVCYDDEITDGLTLLCGHTYCRECLLAQVNSIISDRSFPLTCISCDGCVVLRDLQSIGNQIVMDKIAQAAYGKFLLVHKDQFANCLTPDCPQVYQRLENDDRESDPIFTCSCCGNRYCKRCEVEFHNGQKCDQYQEHKVLVQNSDRFMEKYIQENDVRKCPGCNMLIEKIDGCNRVTCGTCQKSICWFTGCMQIFNTSTECYSHMQQAHANYW